VLVTPSPRYIELADRWIRGIRDAFTGTTDVADALQRAAVDIDAIVAGTA
jgi:hypothetical protein